MGGRVSKREELFLALILVGVRRPKVREEEAKEVVKLTSVFSQKPASGSSPRLGLGTWQQQKAHMPEKSARHPIFGI